MRIGIVGNNSEKYIQLLLDIWNNGDCAVLIDKQTPLARICEMLLEAQTIVSTYLCYRFCFVRNHSCKSQFQRD